MLEKPSIHDDPGFPTEIGNGGDEDESEDQVKPKLKPIRKKPPKREKLTDEQIDVIAETAFTLGAFFMEGMIYAANEWRKKREAKQETPPEESIG